MTTARLLASLALAAALTACDGGGGQAGGDPSSSPSPSGSSTTDPSEEPTTEPSEPEYPEQLPEDYPVRPAVTVYGERALTPCRLAPSSDVTFIFGPGLGETPQTEEFLEHSVPAPGQARDLDAALETECTHFGTGSVSLRITPVAPGDISNVGLSYDAVRGLRNVRLLAKWERKSPYDEARAFIKRLTADAKKAKERDPGSYKPQRIWALRDFRSVNDFGLLTIIDHQEIDLQVDLGDAGESHSALVTGAGKVEQLLQLIEANASNPDLPQGPATTTTGASENEQGVPIPEPCAIFTSKVFRTLFGVPDNDVTGHTTAPTEVFPVGDPVRVGCERNFASGNLARPGPFVLQRFGAGGDWKVDVDVAVYPSEKAATKTYAKQRGPARHEVPTRADQAYISYSPAFDVTVSAMRVGPYIVSVSYYGNKARSGIDFANIELPEPAPATTTRFFNLLTPGFRAAAKGT